MVVNGYCHIEGPNLLPIAKLKPTTVHRRFGSLSLKVKTSPEDVNSSNHVFSPYLKMRQVIKALILQIMVSIPVATPSNLNTH